jgi:hypothetical protein
MAVNKLLQRWVLASVAKHLHAAAAEINLPLHVEFLDTRSAAFKSAPLKAEATIIGPATRHLSPGFTHVVCAVFVKVSSVPALDTNAWGHSDAVGRLQSALHECIMVKKYAVGEASPDEVFVLEHRPDQPVNVTNLTPSVTDQLLHSVINAEYRGYIL